MSCPGLPLDPLSSGEFGAWGFFDSSTGELFGLRLTNGFALFPLELGPLMGDLGRQDAPPDNFPSAESSNDGIFRTLSPRLAIAFLFGAISSEDLFPFSSLGWEMAGVSPLFPAVLSAVSSEAENWLDLLSASGSSSKLARAWLSTLTKLFVTVGAPAPLD